MVTLSFPFLTPNITVLFSYNPHLSCQQVLQTPPSKYVWSVTLSLHFHCSLNYSSSLLTCICPHHPLPRQKKILLSVYYKAQKWFLRNLRPDPSSLPLPPLLAVTPVSCSVSALTPLILTLLSWPPCPEPLGHLPVAPALAPPSARSSLSRSAWAPASPSEICLQPSEQSPHTPVWTHFPPSLSIPLSSFLFLLILSTCTQVYFPYCPYPTVERNSSVLFPHGWIQWSQNKGSCIVNPQYIPVEMVKCINALKKYRMKTNEKPWEVF